MKNYKFVINGLLVVLLVGIFVSCGQPTSWYPVGSVIITDKYESNDTVTKSVVVTVTIENTGSSSINSITYTLTVTTDLHTYYKTINSSTRVLPGGKVKETIKISYDALVEVLKTEGVTVSDAFFE